MNLRCVMIERLWFVERTGSERVVLDWRISDSDISREEREEIEARVAGLGEVIKYSRAFLAWTNINYGFVDIVIGIGRLGGREGSFHLVIPSMPSEPAWVEFRIDDACIGGVSVQETLAEVVEHEEDSADADRKHYYEEDTNVLIDDSEED